MFVSQAVERLSQGGAQRTMMRIVKKKMEQCSFNEGFFHVVQTDR